MNSINYKKKINFKMFGLIFFFIFINNFLFAKSYNFSGIVTDASTKTPISGAKVFIKNTNKNFKTDVNGKFKFAYDVPSFDLVVTYPNYESRTIYYDDMWREEINISLTPNKIYEMESFTVFGSRHNIERSNLESINPIDVITAEQITATGANELSKVIASIIPSFNSQKQTFSDGNDHTDPATLRNLGPDQVLVLINGKRRHTSSLVTVTPIVGRGTVGTDLNSIPVSSIERIEILRNGASVQYGSDAIAGIINIVLKSDTKGINIGVQSGMTTKGDGQNNAVSANYGISLPNNGFINLTAEARRREPTNRVGEYTGLVYRTANQDSLTFERNHAIDDSLIAAAGKTKSDYNLVIGNSALTNIGLFLNSSLPINENTEFYAFGGLNYRDSRAPGFYRFPNDPRNNTKIYPDGFLPYLNAKIYDKSLALGTKTMKSGWAIDLSNVYGSNTFDNFVDNSLNRAYGDESPTSFYCGSFEFTQNTTNLDFSKSFKIDDYTFNLSMGLESRFEQYQIIAGEEASYASKYDKLNPGAQVFPGFRPENAINKSRNSFATYADGELSIGDLLLNTAGRFETYSDFGNSADVMFGAKTNKIENILTVRASTSTGFRAPSLHQRYFSNLSTFFVDFGTGLYPVDIATLNNDSRIVKALGVEPLKNEKSFNVSTGITLDIDKNTYLTADAYQIKIKDRIVLSSYFYIFDPYIGNLLKDMPGVEGFQFFTNAIDTKTTGIDLILGHSLDLFDGKLNFTAAFSYAKTELDGAVKTTSKLDSNYSATLFSKEEITRMENGQPNLKGSLTISYADESFTCSLINTYYGEVNHVVEDGKNDALNQIYQGKLITDLRLSYNIFSGISLYAGADNLLDIYPDKNKITKQDNGRFPYNTAVTQFGFNGRYIYAGLNINL